MTDYTMNFDAQLSFSGTLDPRVHTYEQLLDEMPFSPEVRKWFDDHNEVKTALKIFLRDRFVPVHAISIVDSPDLAGVKQAIGMYSIDTKMGNQIKQDYIMHQDDDTFAFFTGLSHRVPQSTYVRHVEELKDCYGTDGINYFNDHHQTIEQVSELVRLYVEAALKTIVKR